MGISGRELMIEHASDKKIVSTSLVKLRDPQSNNMKSKIRLVVPIILSHTPPMCEERGKLKIHVVPCSVRQSYIGPSFTLSVLICNSFTAPTKLVPLSERMILIQPRIAINRMREFMNAEVVISSSTSIWTALIARHVKRTAHPLLVADPPLVFLVIISQGPKTYTPINQNGGYPGRMRSAGKSDIFWQSKGLRSLHITQLCIREV